MDLKEEKKEIEQLNGRAQELRENGKEFVRNGKELNGEVKEVLRKSARKTTKKLL